MTLPSDKLVDWKLKIKTDTEKFIENLFDNLGIFKLVTYLEDIKKNIEVARNVLLNIKTNRKNMTDNDIDRDIENILRRMEEILSGFNSTKGGSQYKWKDDWDSKIDSIAKFGGADIEHIINELDLSNILERKDLPYQNNNINSIDSRYLLGRVRQANEKILR